MAERRNWTKEETILAFELYCRTPFGKIHASNPEIIQLANMIGRTPASVALKMSNLAAYDPELQARSIKGMSHTSKLDSIVFNEFYQNLAELKYQTELIKKQSYGSQSNAIWDELTVEDIFTPGMDKERLFKTRIGQYAFRISILNAYHNSCCITGLKEKQLLVASHIKPWAVSDELKERTNPTNGLCLNAFHDKAFDQGLITIDQSYHIVVSSHLKNADMDSETREWMMYYNKKEILLPDKFKPGKDFIQYHNDVIFRP